MLDRLDGISDQSNGFISHMTQFFRTIKKNSRKTQVLGQSLAEKTPLSSSYSGQLAEQSFLRTRVFGCWYVTGRISSHVFAGRHISSHFIMPRTTHHISHRYTVAPLQLHHWHHNSGHASGNKKKTKHLFAQKPVRIKKRTANVQHKHPAGWFSARVFFSGGAESQSTADHGISGVFWRSKNESCNSNLRSPNAFCIVSVFSYGFIHVLCVLTENGGPPGRLVLRPCAFRCSQKQKISVLRLTSHFSEWFSKWTQSFCCDPRKVGSEDPAA